MRALIPEPAIDVDVHEHYARHWLDRGGVRANFISSVDGAVSVAGLSRGLQTPGDNRVFAVLRDLTDVVLVGAGTARMEGYAAIRVSADRQATRKRFGLSEELPTAVVSQSRVLVANSLGSGRAVYVGWNVYGPNAGPNDLAVLRNAILWAAGASVGPVAPTIVQQPVSLRQ